MWRITVAGGITWALPEELESPKDLELPEEWESPEEELWELWELGNYKS